MPTAYLQGIQIKAVITSVYAEILNPEALTFIADLHRQFNARRLQLLAARTNRQIALDKGKLFDFLPETQAIRQSDWTVAPLPPDLIDRRVEITGPVERKMMINALNSGAKVFMADLEDSNSPTWDNIMEGQINLRDAVNGSISFQNPDNGKQYRLNDQIATLMVRPRGWHLNEKHIEIDGEIMSGSLLDFGLHFFHNAQALIDKGSGPYFYLPKIESHLEARLWNEVFVYAQNKLGIAQGTIKATVLIETLPAAFEMHEILYELRQHSAGLNCGRWDYIFSFIKKMRHQSNALLPDRAQVTMTTPCMRAYSLLLIKTCHQRGVHAMGGMAAQIPIKNDTEANNIALAKVRTDKEREASDGHDGTWVAHPGLVSLAMDVFDKYMPNPNQINNKRNDIQITAADLLAIPQGTITEAGLRTNINVGILYIESWLRGVGAAAIYNLMEDAATAEISRTQVWQWLHSKAQLADTRILTTELYQQLLDDEVNNIKISVGEQAFNNGQYAAAAQLFNSLVLQTEYIEFLTLNAYEQLV